MEINQKKISIIRKKIIRITNRYPPEIKQSVDDIVQDFMVMLISKKNRPLEYFIIDWVRDYYKFNRKTKTNRKKETSLDVLKNVASIIKEYNDDSYKNHLDTFENLLVSLKFEYGYESLEIANMASVSQSRISQLFSTIYHKLNAHYNKDN